MFDDLDSVVGLSELGVVNGESHHEREADQIAYELTCRALADGWHDDEQHALPDLDQISPGPLLFAILASVDRSKLNGYDLVRLLKARERLVSHCQAGGMADAVQMSYASPGDSESMPERTFESAEFAAEIRERLPRVWRMLDSGSIDLARAWVIA